ncbi:MAG: toprim domain-containing protein [Acidiferrobacter sp.]
MSKRIPQNSGFASPPHIGIILSRVDGVIDLGHGKYKALCPVHDDHSPSLFVTDEGDRVLLHCQACHAKYKEIMGALGLPQAVGFANYHDCTNRIGGLRRAIDGDYQRPKTKLSSVKANEISKRIGEARTIWSKARPLTEITSYLKSRGFDNTDLPWLSKVARVGVGWSPLHKREMPAVIWSTHDPRDGDLMAIQYEFGKGDRAYRGRHILEDGKVACWAQIGETTEGGTLWTGEGAGTCGAVHKVTQDCTLIHFDRAGLEAWAEATTEKAKAEKVSRIVIAADNDKSGDGEKSAEICARRIQDNLSAEDGIQVFISMPCEVGKDWLDVLNEAGPEGCKIALMANMRRPTPPTTRGPNGGKQISLPGNDMLSMADLSGGPLGPEPPPHPGLGPTRNILPFIPWRSLPHAAPRPDLPSLAVMQDQLKTALPAAIQAAITGKPVLIMVPPGGGKTALTLDELLKTRVPIKDEDGEACGDRAANFLWASATKELANEALQIAISAAVGPMTGWDGRQVPGLCDLPAVTGALMDRGRSPHQHACQTCPQGRKPQGDEPDMRCQFQRNLSDAPYFLGIFGQHGIIGRESTLLKWANDPRDDFQDRDITVIDEGVSTFSMTEITARDVGAARVAAGAIDEHINELRAKDLKKRNRKGRETDEPRFSEEDYAKAMAWGAEIASELDRIANEIVTGAGRGLGLYPFDKETFAEFVRLGQKIPAAALVLDASALEKVRAVFSEQPIIPLAWIHDMATAIKSGTAWVRVAKDGVDVICTNPSDLYTRYLTKGGVLLDAGCTHVDEILAAGGVVIDLRCAQPHLKTVQYGPRLHGKGDSGRSEAGRKQLKSEAAELRAAMGDDPDVVVITHKALTKLMDDERVRGWGRHKGHNDWKHKKRLILWGLPLMNAQDQIIGYKTYRAAMAARGIDLPDWNGERSREWVATDGWEIMPAAGLPAVKEARDWLLRELNAEIMQAVGRLRAVWATEPVTVELYGFLPIVGFGLRVDEIRLERTGRMPTKVKTLQTRAQAVVELGADAPRRAVSDFMYSIDGIRHSNATIDCLMDELRADARESRMTIDQSARKAIAMTRWVLDIKESGGDFNAALTKVCTSTSPAMQAVAIILTATQHTQAPGTQRAGP